MNILHSVSIFLEVMTALLGYLLATIKKKTYGWGIAITFLIYTVYDICNFIGLRGSQEMLYSLFFVASFSILWAVWQIYQEAR